MHRNLHGLFSPIRQVARMCTLSIILWTLWVHIPTSIEPCLQGSSHMFVCSACFTVAGRLPPKFHLPGSSPLGSLNSISTSQQHPDWFSHFCRALTHGQWFDTSGSWLYASCKSVTWCICIYSCKLFSVAVISLIWSRKIHRIVGLEARFWH